MSPNINTIFFEFIFRKFCDLVSWMEWSVWTPYFMLDDNAEPSTCYKGKRSRYRNCVNVNDDPFAFEFGLDGCDSEEAKKHIDFVEEVTPKIGKEYQWETHTEYDTDGISSCSKFYYQMDQFCPLGGSHIELYLLSHMKKLRFRKKNRKFLIFLIPFLISLAHITHTCQLSAF